MDDRLRRIEEEIRRLSLKLRRPAVERQVVAFERRHGVRLPEGYRRFVLEIGDGGSGPPLTGLFPLGRKGKGPLTPEFLRGRQRLPTLAQPFPFTRGWIWEDGEESDEGNPTQVGDGNLLLGEHGCGIEWRLIVTGPERGRVWEFCDVGIGPMEPGQDFLGWYQSWLAEQPGRSHSS